VFAPGFLPLAKELPPGLVALDVGANSLYAAGAAALAARLHALPLLSSLNLANNEIKAEGATALAEALSAMAKKGGKGGGGGGGSGGGEGGGGSALVTLDVSFNNLGIVGASNLASALPTMKRLRSLSLAGANIYATGAEALGRVLARVPSLALLDASGANSLGVDGKQALRGAVDAVNKGAPRLELKM
jgi:Ran GTPase-activating protein (RanGAP) involved in mRNA processing and transport